MVRDFLLHSLICVNAFVAISCSSLTYFCPGEPLSETEIRNIGIKKLKAFCEWQKVDMETFPSSEPQLKFIAEESIWVVDYNGTDKFVRFIVDNCGRVETSVGQPTKITRISD